MLPNLGHGIFKRLGAGVVLGACILAASAGRLPASPKSGDPGPLDAGYLEATAFIDDSRQAVRQDTATQGDRQAQPLFGLETEPVAGEVATKWRAVEADIDREQRVLARWRVGAACPADASSLLNIVAEGAGRSGRARVGLINRAVDLAIAATSDQAQWGVADHRSPPFETLRAHRGDCEDYAIVKYLALLQAGLPSDDVKIIILRIPLRKEDHAAVAARVDGRWLIMDNRRLALVRDMEMIGSIPRFVLDEDGTRRFVPSNRLPNPGRLSQLEDVQIRFITANLVEATNRSLIFNACKDSIQGFAQTKMEMPMRKIILTVLAVPLLAALNGQAASASEPHPIQTKGRTVAIQQPRSSDAYAIPGDIAARPDLSAVDESAMTSGPAGH